jgi:hypothetical protein
MPFDHPHGEEPPKGSECHFRFADVLSKGGFFEHKIDVCCLKHLMNMIADLVSGSPIVIQQTINNKVINRAFYLVEGDSIVVTGPVGRQYQERMRLVTGVTLNKLH